MTAVAMAHVWLDDCGVAWIGDTNTKVSEVALDHLAHGWSPEEIHFQHSHLSLAQIHAALGYYYDHQSEMDSEFRQSVEEAKRMRERSGDSPLRKRLGELGTAA